MRTLRFVLAILLGVAGLGAHANAQNYPWCAFYGAGRGGGGTNCGFVSFEQCMADLRGIGGICMRNTQYVPGRGPGASNRSRHRHYHPD